MESLCHLFICYGVCIAAVKKHIHLRDKGRSIYNYTEIIEVSSSFVQIWFSKYSSSWRCPNEIECKNPRENAKRLYWRWCGVMFKGMDSGTRYHEFECHYCHYLSCDFFLRLLVTSFSWTCPGSYYDYKMPSVMIRKLWKNFLLPSGLESILYTWYPIVRSQVQRKHRRA